MTTPLSSILCLSLKSAVYVTRSVVAEIEDARPARSNAILPEKRFHNLSSLHHFLHYNVNQWHTGLNNVIRRLSVFHINF